MADKDSSAEPIKGTKTTPKVNEPNKGMGVVAYLGLIEFLLFYLRNTRMMSL